ncbi:MAG: hypothetical protein NTX50_03330 [Candidatus Sumerlaeota bacterium]|nr:hypothetical protein [Candidatus Sumerlaeota bacterium]
MPLSNAVAVWHMGDLRDGAGASSALAIHGNVRLGVALQGREREESLRRGGDGMAADFSSGGWLSAGQGADGELNISSAALTLCARLRDPSGKWDGPIFSKHGGHARLSYNLFSTALRGKMAIGFELGTSFKPQPLQVSFPIERLDATAWHDVIVRYSGHRLELFIDGALVDEEWPAGSLRLARDIPCLIGAEIGDDGVTPRGKFQGLIDHIALWKRALSDDEIALLSGGRETMAQSEQKLLGLEDQAIKEFWRPRGDLFVGDCMPFFDGQRWHLFYLQDRHAHRSKWGLGAHQWAHVSTADFARWERHPMAVPITDSREGSICTGSTFFHDGEYRAYYAVRSIDGSPAPLSMAMSRDGVHFTKTDWRQTLTAPYTGASARDPNVFQDSRDGLFHIIVTTSQADKTGADRGCLAHLVSKDLRQWEQRAPFIVPGLPGEPECPEWWEWNGWYYLVFSNGGIARYRMSRDPLGPWTAPAVDAFDGRHCIVMKSAPFLGGRRIGAAFLPRAGGGYAGNVIFRELIQLKDGALATRFVPELMPKIGEPAKLKPIASETNAADGSGKFVIRSTGARGSLAFSGLPHNAHLSARLHALSGTESFGLVLRLGEDKRLATEIRFIPAKRRVEVIGGAALDQVDGLNDEMTIDLYLKEDMLDICLNGHRTLASRVADGHGDGLVFFSEGGETYLDALEARPLIVAP